ncbi:hypothetical protein [Halobellus clavatus]|uniref:Uncharacterized protein n=1 Tax=Halobellus clavatus TaxID=660517 RepID=A0A1H3JJM7_9EURY|nr:hypothetical protein [Halobellus clavatus]SDY40153.1 hypothetical protein SAMN04487946_11415 [Halobellus clavatus]
MSRLADLSLEDLLTLGGPRIRGIVLFAGLGILALVNYLDLVGVLGLGWMNDTVGWAAAFWTGFVALLINSRRELHKRVKELGALLVLVFGLVAVGLVTSPGLGPTYWYHETLVGQLTWAAAPSVGNAGIVLGTAYLVVLGIEWISEYWYLRQTTAEERILEEDP